MLVGTMYSPLYQSVIYYSPFGEQYGRTLSIHKLYDPVNPTPRILFFMYTHG